MHKHSSQRIAVLIDANNVEISTKELFKTNIDYNTLIHKVNGRELVRMLYFRPETQPLNGLKHVLESAGIEIRLTPKNSDCWLTVDAISLIPKIDVLVLVAGDADYIPLIWYVRSRGVKTEVWMWDDNTSRSLKETADNFIPLSKECLFNK